MARLGSELEAEDHPVYGDAVPVEPGVCRVTAHNPSPFTFWGTNTYIIGTGTLGIIDPGPDDPEHLQLLLSVIGERPVSHIIVTHTHRDHSALAPRLKAATGALTAGQGRHRRSGPTGMQGDKLVEAGSDLEFLPDLILQDGDTVAGDGWSLEAIHTPGHATNHMAFHLVGTDILFSGDHVMGWSTTIVAPPDGSMSDYIASLDKLLERNDKIYLPGHGGAILQPLDHVRRIRAHRKMREAMILTRIRKGDRTIAEIVTTLYRRTDPNLLGAACLTVLAHVESLIERGLVRADGATAKGGVYEPV